MPPPSSAGLVLATLTTNIAANVVAPAVAMVNAAPRSLSFTAGGLITALLGLLSMPWRLYGSFLNFLVAYSVLLGPVVSVPAACACFWFCFSTACGGTAYRLRSSTHHQPRPLKPCVRVPPAGGCDADGLLLCAGQGAGRGRPVLQLTHRGILVPGGWVYW